MALRGTAPELGDISCAYCIGGMRPCVSVGWLPFLIEVHIKTLIGPHFSPQLQTNAEKPAELLHLPYGMWWGEREVTSRPEPVENRHRKRLSGRTAEIPKETFTEAKCKRERSYVRPCF
jgi:hypothetical protein